MPTLCMACGENTPLQENKNGDRLCENCYQLYLTELDLKDLVAETDHVIKALNKAIHETQGEIESP